MNLFAKCYALLSEYGPMTAGEMKLRSKEPLGTHTGDISRSLTRGAKRGYIQIDTVPGYPGVKRYALTDKEWHGRNYYHLACALLATDGCAWIFPSCRAAATVLGVSAVSVQMAVRNGWRVRGERVIEMEH